VGALFGYYSAGSTGLPIWAAVRAIKGYNTLEHIYYNATASSWSKKAPLGCTDGGSGGTTACSSSGSITTRMSGSGPKDVWLVGSAGLIMHYDGAKWSSITGKIKNQTTYSFDAVYSSAAAKLTTVVGHQDTLTGRAIVLFNYNSHLDRWLGPVVIHSAGKGNFKDYARDIDGTGYANLWIVGSRIPTNVTPPSPYTSGWILELQ